jgi:HSP20 family molecular chaperone IbpA
MFGLSTLAETFGRALDPLVHMRSNADKSIDIVFRGFDDCSAVDVDIEVEERLITIFGKLDERVCKSRVFKLPCGIKNAEKIVGELKNGTVTVTIPPECQVDISAPPTPPATPVEAHSKKLKVRVVPSQTGVMHFEHKDGKLKISMLGMSPNDVSVELDGKNVNIQGTAQNGIKVVRHHKLHRRVIKPDTITAAVDAAGKLEIIVPDDALEHKHTKVKHQIKVTV